MLRRSQIRVVTMAEIDRLGMEGAVDVALDRLRAAPWVHVSLDMDVMDPAPRARRRHAGARRHQLPRGAPDDGDGGRVAG